MKKLLTMFLAVMFLSGIIFVGKSQAFEFTVGDEYSFRMSGDSWVNLDTGLLSGYFQLSQIENISDPNEGIIFNQGDDNDYLHVAFGNLAQINSFEDNPSGTGYYSGGYADFYLHDNDDIYYKEVRDDTRASPHDNAGDSLGDEGEKILSLEFTEGEYTVNDATFKVNLDQTNPPRISSSGFLSILEGEGHEWWETLFDSDQYLNDIADFYISGNASFQNTIDNFDRYFSTSYSAEGTAVPEPGTLFLLGTGLLGLAGFAGRIRKRNTE